MIFIESLQPLDYLFAILVIIFVFFSAWKGFILSFLNLLTWVGSIFITIYFHGYLSDFILDFLTQNETWVSSIPQLDFIVRYIVSIPIVFFISLFLLKKFRKFITSDLEKRFLGIILDKFFGIIFGLIFCYGIFTTILLAGNILENDFLKEQLIPNIKNNSNILIEIEKFNLIIKPKNNIINQEIN